MKCLLRACLAFCVLLSPAAQAAEPLQISNAWVPEAPPIARVLAGYLSIHNPGERDVTITGARSMDFAVVEMHETRVEGDIARMIRQDTLVIPAGKTVKFERGGLHLMLMQPKRGFKAGDSMVVEFVTSGGKVTFTAEVKPASLDDRQHDHHHHH